MEFYTPHFTSTSLLAETAFAHFIVLTESVGARLVPASVRAVALTAVRL
jgi:hypothetical protein